MLLCLGDANQQKVSSEFKITYMKLGIQIANENEKLYTMLSQVNVSQNSRKMIHLCAKKMTPCTKKRHPLQKNDTPRIKN